MSRRKEKLNIAKTSSNQNLQLLIVWTIFLGIIVLFFHLIYKYLIKIIFNYILFFIGMKDSNINDNANNINTNTNNHDRTINTNLSVLNGAEVNTNLQNENFILSNDNSIFRVSIGFCYSKEADNLKKSKVKESLIKLSSFTDLFLFIQVDTEQDELVILNYMQEFGIFNAGLKKHRIVFCEKPESIPSMARQLQANMHIDTNQDNTQKLLNKVPNISILTLDDDGSSLYEIVETIESVVASK